MLQKVDYMGLSDCYKLTNGEVEIIVPTLIGPRILSYGPVGGLSILGQCPELSQETDLGLWKPWGGHRLWLAPEEMPRSYLPDNEPIDFEEQSDKVLRLVQKADLKVGLQKELIVKLEPNGSKVTVVHRLTNYGLWTVELAPWALTIMQVGGVAILPQEPYRAHSEYLLPARPMVLWHYTDLSDPRWSIGKNYLCLRTIDSLEEPQKLGIANKAGWAAYHHEDRLFVKRFNFQPGAIYPDLGCNNEVFTAGSFLEIESLGPLVHLKPNETVEHQENWYLFQDLPTTSTDELLHGSFVDYLSSTVSLFS